MIRQARQGYFAMRVFTILAMLTILTIAGTLTACGRYGRPVRPAPEAGLALDVVRIDGLESKQSSEPQHGLKKRSD